MKPQNTVLSKLDLLENTSKINFIRISDFSDSAPHKHQQHATRVGRGGSSQTVSSLALTSQQQQPVVKSNPSIGDILDFCSRRLQNTSGLFWPPALTALLQYSKGKVGKVQ